MVGSPPIRSPRAQTTETCVGGRVPSGPTFGSTATRETQIEAGRGWEDRERYSVVCDWFLCVVKSHMKYTRSLRLGNSAVARGAKAGTS